MIRVYMSISQLNAFKLYFLENEALNGQILFLVLYLIFLYNLLWIVYSAIVFNRFDVYSTNFQTRSPRIRRVRRKASILYLQFVCSRMISPLSACTTIIAPPCIADSYMYTVWLTSVNEAQSKSIKRYEMIK